MRMIDFTLEKQMDEYWHRDPETFRFRKVKFTGTWYIIGSSHSSTLVVGIYKYSWFPWIFKSFVTEDEIRLVEKCQLRS